MEISKTDITTGEELKGAKLQILNKEGEILEEWVTDGKPHLVEKLPVGEELTLREITAPEGYEIAEDVKFTLEDTMEIQKVEMKDARKMCIRDSTRRGRVGHQIAHTLTTGIQQGTLHFVDLSPPPLVTEHCRCLNTRQSGIHNHKGECSGVLKEEGARAVLTPGREEIRQNGRRMKEPEEPMFTITATDRHGVAYRGRIRKLVPRE